MDLLWSVGWYWLAQVGSAWAGRIGSPRDSLGIPDLWGMRPGEHVQIQHGTNFRAWCRESPNLSESVAAACCSKFWLNHMKFVTSYSFVLIKFMKRGKNGCFNAANWKVHWCPIKFRQPSRPDIPGVISTSSWPQSELAAGGFFLRERHLLHATNTAKNSNIENREISSEQSMWQVL